MSEAEAAAFLTRMNTAPLFSPGDWIQLGIAEPVAERLIGDIGVCVADDEMTAQIGFTLDPEFQGRGIATAAVREAIHLLLQPRRSGKYSASQTSAIWRAFISLSELDSNTKKSGIQFSAAIPVAKRFMYLRELTPESFQFTSRLFYVAVLAWLSSSR